MFLINATVSDSNKPEHEGAAFRAIALTKPTLDKAWAARQARLARKGFPTGR